MLGNTLFGGGVGNNSATICQRAEYGGEYEELILATASVLALGMGGVGAGYAADLGNTAPNTGANMPSTSGTSHYSQTVVTPSQDQIEQAQQQLRDHGLYKGQIDGILGPQTKQALDELQKKNGLNQTATLDQPTMDKLLGTGVGQGSSMAPSSNQGTGSMANPHPAAPGTSNLGDHSAPKQ